MNFQDLYKKIQAIDEGTDVPVEECGDEPMPSIEECGMDMIPHQAPKQSDSVTMNVSMNGSGAGGIRDLMDILRNLESGDGPHGDDEIVIGEPAELDAELDDSYANEPDSTVLSIDDVTHTGNDLHSKGAEALKVNGGGNPMQETLESRLAQMYQEVKNR